ncbi:hypothetical protein GCM10028819_39010 [Spirosoma humi]
MNIQEQPVVPGYVVKAKDLSNPNYHKSHTFRDSSLLSSRQAALQSVQRLLTEKQSHQVLDITIDLVEFDRSQIPNPFRIIATVFQQRFQRSQVITQLTFGPTKEDEACNSPKAIWNSLGEMASEYEYYLTQNYDSGFGNVVMNLEGPNKYLPEIKNLSALSDEQIEERLTTLRQPKPYSSFYMLYDAFPHAAKLISQYNNHYASDEGILRFSLDFLSPQ